MYTGKYTDSWNQLHSEPKWRTVVVVRRGFSTVQELLLTLKVPLTICPYRTSRLIQL